MLVIVEGDFVFVASCNSVTVVCCPSGCPPYGVLAAARLVLSDEELRQLARWLVGLDEEP
jgi:hypothetical protein